MQLQAFVIAQAFIIFTYMLNCDSKWYTYMQIYAVYRMYVWK